MEDKTFDIQSYMTAGVENIVKSALRATLRDPRESLFMASFAKATRAASQKRAAAEAAGEHVPAFLIASITSACNLHCAGCYSRTNNACVDEPPVQQLTGAEWGSIFSQAEELGVSFILLAGGEPLYRRDVMDAAAEHPSILFPIFTNGTLINERYLNLFDRRRNLIPIFSIEGGEDTTDERRGDGVYQKLMDSMTAMREKGLIFGCSITVTTENLQEVTSKEYLENLHALGARAVIFVEFVPVTEEATHLAPGDAERDALRDALAQRRQELTELVLVSFPGDEKTSGGCLAAGRGFFHINSHGGAEPCPFSPYSDINVKETSLRDALHSHLFTALREGEVLMEDHAGGCVLFERKDQVEAILAAK